MEYVGQKNFYSGKQKRHTFKNQLIVVPSVKDIVDVVVGKPDTTSEINIWREWRQEFSENQKFQGDKGYLREATIEVPHKKKKTQGLTEQQK